MYQLVSQLHIPDTLLVLEGTLSAADVSELSVLRQLASRFLGDKRYEGFKDALVDLRQELDILLVRLSYSIFIRLFSENSNFSNILNF